jgi:hypothetical protein
MTRSIAECISDAMTVWNLGRTGVMAANPKIVADLCEKMWTNPEYADHREMCRYAERMVVALLTAQGAPEGLIPKVLNELKYASSGTKMETHGRDVVSRRLLNEAHDVIQGLLVELAIHETEKD